MKSRLLVYFPSDAAQSQATSIEEITSSVEEIAASAQSTAEMAIAQERKTGEFIHNLKDMFDLVTKGSDTMAQAMNIKAELNEKIEESRGDVSKCQKSMDNALNSSNQVYEATSLINDIFNYQRIHSASRIGLRQAGRHRWGAGVVIRQAHKVITRCGVNRHTIPRKFL